MAATRENVLAAIVQFVESNKRRAPAKEIASLVSDTVPNVQAIIKVLVSEGAINSSRGRNGGALPDGVTLDKKSKAAKVVESEVDSSPSEEPQDDVADQFAALMAKIEESDSLAAVG